MTARTILGLTLGLLGASACNGLLGVDGPPTGVKDEASGAEAGHTEIPTGGAAGSVRSPTGGVAGPPDGSGAAGRATGGLPGGGGIVGEGTVGGSAGRDAGAGGLPMGGVKTTGGLAGIGGTGGQDPTTGGQITGGESSTGGSGGSGGEPSGGTGGDGGDAGDGGSGGNDDVGDPTACENGGEDVVLAVSIPNVVGDTQYGRRGLVARVTSDGSIVPSWSHELHADQDDGRINALKVGDDGAVYVVGYQVVAGTARILLHKIDPTGELVDDAVFPLIVATATNGCFCGPYSLYVEASIAYSGGRCDCVAWVRKYDLTDGTRLWTYEGGSTVESIAVDRNGIVFVSQNDVGPNGTLVRALDPLSGSLAPTGSWWSTEAADAPDRTPYGITATEWNPATETIWVAGHWASDNPPEADLGVWSLSSTLAPDADADTLYRVDTGRDGTVHDMAIDTDGSAHLTARLGPPGERESVWVIKKLRPDGVEVTAGWDKEIPGGRASAIEVDSTGEVYVTGTNGEGAVVLRKFAASGTMCWERVITTEPNATPVRHALGLL